MHAHCQLPSLCQIVISLILFFFIKLLFNWHNLKKAKMAPKIHKTDWQENVVYLYQFPRSKYCPNVSPFCLKLEAYLRVFDIKYEVVDTTLTRSSKGLLPFVELNGQQLADSQLIIMALQKHFNIDAKENLSEEQLGIIRCVDRMLEGSFFNANYIFKLLNNSMNFATVVTEDRNPKFLKYVLAPVLYYKAKKRGEAEGTANHSQEECLSILRNDMKAIDQILGNKDFLIGNKPTLADCTLFGHLASTYYLPYDMPLKQILDEEFPRIKKHMERMASLYFKDHKIGQQD